MGKRNPRDYLQKLHRKLKQTVEKNIPMICITRKVIYGHDKVLLFTLKFSYVTACLYWAVSENLMSRNMENKDNYFQDFSNGFL